ncbi:MAG: hypothetical protein DME98_02255 [Verrucomicrobia bacterium]|nr:MAG: hypothetical protein DME98_02255 [Verrucomicrobiota bacterium]PYJ31268.1 MAG: hypothetical protein DME88_15915 [Verrucomicrobiota bacterium]
MAADIKKNHPDWRVKETKDLTSGFTDYKFYPVIDGRERELSVMTEGVHEMTNQTHGPYEQKQFIIRNANNERRELTAAENDKVKELDELMKQHFTTVKVKRKVA